VFIADVKLLIAVSPLACSRRGGAKTAVRRDGNRGAGS
jgi:hypothetical protein